MRFRPLKVRLAGALCLSALLASAVCGTVSAQQVESNPAAAGGERKITLALREVPLRTVLDNIFSSSGLQYTVDSNIPDPLITLNIRDVGLQQALRNVISIARSQIPGLALRKEGDLYMIQIKRETPPSSPVEDTPPEETAVETETT